MSKPRKRRSSRAKPGALPKGAYRLPSGDYVMKPLTTTVGPGDRRISVVAVRRAEPDLQRLAKLLVQMICDEAARDQDSDTTV